MKFITPVSLLFLFLIFLFSCKKENPEIVPLPHCDAGELKYVLVPSGNAQLDEFIYDAAGRILEVKNTYLGRERFVNFQYDDIEKTASVKFTGPYSYSGEEIVELAFDDNWNLTEIKGEDPSYFTYDAEGRLIESELIAYEDSLLKYHFKYYYSWVDGNIVEILRKNMSFGTVEWINDFTYHDLPNTNNLPLVRIQSTHTYDFVEHFLRPMKNVVAVRYPGAISYHYAVDQSGNVYKEYWLSEEGEYITSRLYGYYCD